MSVEELVMTQESPSHGALKGWGSTAVKGRDIMARLGISHLAHRQVSASFRWPAPAGLDWAYVNAGSRLLLLDEPFANVDSDTVDILIRILRQMADDGTTIIIVLRYGPFAPLADEILMLNGGHARWVAPSELHHQQLPAQAVPFSLGEHHAGTA